MMRLVPVALLAAASAQAGPFDGLYLPDQPWAEGWDCTTVGMDGGALAVREGMFLGVENACRLTNPVPVNGMDAVLYDAECGGEGETHRHRMMLMRLPDGLAVIEDGFVNLLKSCR